MVEWPQMAAVTMENRRNRTLTQDPRGNGPWTSVQVADGATAPNIVRRLRIDIVLRWGKNALTWWQSLPLNNCRIFYHVQDPQLIPEYQTPGTGFHPNVGHDYSKTEFRKQFIYIRKKFQVGVYSSRRKQIDMLKDMLEMIGQRNMLQHEWKQTKLEIYNTSLVAWEDDATDKEGSTSEDGATGEDWGKGTLEGTERRGILQVGEHNDPRYIYSEDISCTPGENATAYGTGKKLRSEILTV